MDIELRTYIENRRAEIEERRRAAAGRSIDWAADGAIHELDRLLGWLNLSRQRALPWSSNHDQAMRGEARGTSPRAHRPAGRGRDRPRSGRTKSCSPQPLPP